MTWQSHAVVAALAAVLVGCGPRESGSRDNSGSSTSGMANPPITTDTASTGGTTDTALTGAATRFDSARSDSAKGTQTKSGVTNTKTGKSTTGSGVTKTRPDQGQPVTSKGDTIGRSDSTKPPR
jgi:hypothetical protein